ncbi:hypothetical protein ACET3Z_029021 [Daucus carota]
MDTGSDVVWLPCSPFSCMLCEGKSPSTISNLKPLNISAAKKVPCKARACSSVHSRIQSSDLCAMARCPLEDIEVSDCAKFSCPPFYYAYGDGSFVAELYRDTLEIPMSNPSLNLHNFTFGCAHDALGEPIGVAGFGRGALSLPAQLATSNPHLGNQFSYCLISHSFDSARVRKPSPLILGRYVPENKNKRVESQNDIIDFIYTPLLENPTHPYFYLVGLEAVTVGKKRLTAPLSLTAVDKKGNGGMVVDSGTTYTMLPVEMYKPLVTEFSRRVETFYKRASHVEDRTGLSPCYYIDSVKNVPQLIFHFVGNSSVVMPRKNYFYEFLDGGDDGKSKRKVGCVMLMNGGDFPESDGPSGLLGNYQQQGFEVIKSDGKLVVGRGCCVSATSPLQSELIAIREACLIIRHHHLFNACIESDCKSAISFCSTESTPP